MTRLIYIFTTLNLGASWPDEIGTSLMVRMLSHQTIDGWFVTLEPNQYFIIIAHLLATQIQNQYQQPLGCIALRL